jgi:hypothetical protein
VCVCFGKAISIHIHLLYLYFHEYQSNHFLNFCMFIINISLQHSHVVASNCSNPDAVPKYVTRHKSHITMFGTLFVHKAHAYHVCVCIYIYIYKYICICIKAFSCSRGYQSMSQCGQQIFHSHCVRCMANPRLDHISGISRICDFGMYVCVCVCMYVYMYVCILMMRALFVGCIYVCMYICMYVCMYTRNSMMRVLSLGRKHTCSGSDSKGFKVSSE